MSRPLGLLCSPYSWFVCSGERLTISAITVTGGLGSSYHDRMRIWGIILVLAIACGDGTGSGWRPAEGAPNLLAAMDVWAFSPTDVWVVDGSSTIQRYDGDGWSTLSSESDAGLLCIFALSPTEVWLCSGDDVVFYDGATFESMEASQPTGLRGITDVWASSRSDVWAVGDDAIIAHYDGGAWGRTIAGSPFKSSIWGSGPSDVYALSTFDLVHYDGSSWTEIDLDAFGGDGQVWGTSASDVWVMTDSSEISHFDGVRWDTIDALDMVGDLAAVWGPSPNDLWAVGSAGAIAHFDGDSWRQVAHQRIGAPYLRLFRAVHGTSSADVWAVGQELGTGGSTGLIFRYQP